MRILFYFFDNGIIDTSRLPSFVAMPSEIEPPKTSVPWTGFDVFWLLSIWSLPLLTRIVNTLTAAENTKDYGHPIAQLLEQGAFSPVIFLVIFIIAVIIAPLVEEFLFRMLLQGWLAAKLTQCRIPYATGIAIVLVSCFFAAVHMGNHDKIDVSPLLTGLVMSGLFSLLIFASGIIYLTERRRVRMTGYLFGTKPFFHSNFFVNAGYGLPAFLIIFLLFGMTAVLRVLFPGMNVSPIPIFFFSLVLGVLYSRTQNLSYCILLHALLNGTSLMLLWFQMLSAK